MGPELIKRIYFFSFILFPVLVNAQRTNLFDVQHYRFELELTDNSDTIKSHAFISIKFLEPVNTLTLDLTSVSENGKGMAVLKVQEDGKPVSYIHGRDELSISLFQPAKKNEIHTFDISYSGIPADGLIISKNKFGHRTFFADNWPDRAHQWIPCVDDPADKASVEFIVITPNHYQVISNGIVKEITNLDENRKLTHWTEDTVLPTKIMVIGVAAFAVNLAGEVKGIPVYSWVFPEQRQEGFYDYEPAKDILSFFINYIGPYGYKKLANVQSRTIFGGMENANAIFYFENSVTGNGKLEDLIAHEIAHQWFGDMATEKSFAHVWLSEGFATYMTDIYLESKYGKDSMNNRLQEERRTAIDYGKTTLLPVIDSVSEYMDLLNHNSYQKGAWILHMLRREIGDTIFHKIIQIYYTRYAGKNADSKDFQNVAEEVSGKKLGKFFYQWLNTPGNPQLQVNWNYDDKNKNIIINTNQLQKKSVFEFPLEIQLKFRSGKQELKSIKISTQSQTFTFPVREKPISINLDPSTSLLFEGNVLEIRL